MEWCQTGHYFFVNRPKNYWQWLLFFENNPLASPPEHLNFVGDVNIGHAYFKTYKQLISRPGEQVWMPVIFYIDAGTTGQFANFPMYF